jgi:hypothetical protein
MSEAHDTRGGIGIELGVVPDPAAPERLCRPGEVVSSLFASGQLPELVDAIFYQKATPHLDGNCHEASLALLRDLNAMGHASGWDLVSGQFPNGDRHTWVECEGWALDLGNGRILICSADDYRTRKGLVVRRRFPARKVNAMKPGAAARRIII